MSNTFYTQKRGATLSLAGTVVLPTGTWTATAQIKDTNLAIIDTVTVTLTPPAGQATAHSILMVVSSTKTALWPIGNLFCDIRFADASSPPVVLPSPTFTIRVIQEITGA